MQKPLLTIAIPTYNRAAILDESLYRLIHDPNFDEAKIELLVSDNASDDNTREVVAKYPIVRYHCNVHNIGFANFTVAMKLASGRYIRIMNDTASFKTGMLGKILSTIADTNADTTNLIFCNPLVRFKKADVVIQSSKALLDLMSYEITWVLNFGMWKEDFEKLNNPDRFVGTLMQHVDWILSEVSNGKVTRVIVDDYLEVQPVKKKGAYNIFDTFINKYFSILQFHGIKGWTFEKEKYRLFRYFILYWYFLLKNDKEYQFDTSGQNVIYRNYWYEPYFLLLMILKSIQNR